MSEGIDRAAVAGLGVMGSGIVRLFVEKGFAVIGHARRPERCASLRDELARAVKMSVRRKRADADLAAQGLERLSLTDDLSAIGDADIFIEAIVEDADAKVDLLRRAAELLPTTATLATNTSSLSVGELACASGLNGRLVGLHFMNPAPLSTLAEVIACEGVEDAHLDRVRRLAEGLGLTVIATEDAPGFAVNRLLMPLIAEAARALADGVATARDLDTAMRLGCGHPMGPLSLADFIGLDVVLHELERMAAELGPRYEPPQNLRDLVAEGRLGRKTGGGFFSSGG